MNNTENIDDLQPMTRIGGPARFLLILGSLGPIGHAPASGTVAVAVAGIPAFALLHRCSVAVFSAILLAFVLGAVAVHQVGDRLLNEKDSRLLVWDEIAGFLTAIVGVPFTWQSALAAFVIERALDIGKVPPARWIERRVPGGWGVVGDDLVAGLCTCGLLHAVIRWAPHWLGLPAGAS